MMPLLLGLGGLVLSGIGGYFGEKSGVAEAGKQQQMATWAVAVAVLLLLAFFVWRAFN